MARIASLTDGRRGPLLFAVQQHAARRLHFVLRLELDGVLKSWAVPKGPSLQSADRRLAVATEDQAFDDAAFEGVNPAKGYGSGNVIVWDCGVYSPDEQQRYAFQDRAQAQARVRQGLADGRLSFILRGEKLKGSFALVRTRGAGQWQLIKQQDRFAGSSDLLALDRSVLSGATLDDIGESPVCLQAGRLVPSRRVEPLPAALSPMLAESGNPAPSGASIRTEPGWSYEPKLDGYRVIAYVQDDGVRLQSRRGIDLTSAFPEVVAELAQQAGAQMVLDGEIVALGVDGRPSFNALQNRVQLKRPGEIAQAQRTTPVVYVCFDLLHFAGINVRDESYLDRRRYLSQCLLPAPHLQRVHAADDAQMLYAAATASGFEGVIAKRCDSTYQPGRRSAAWMKYKTTQTTEFVIGGYTQGKGQRESLGALLLGYWDRGQLRFAGHVGSGLTTAVIDDLRARIGALARRGTPFSARVDLHRPTRWLEPVLVAEVTFAEWTADGLLRAPVFIRLRDDIESKQISHPRK